jgi:hypothetical protein
MSRRRPLLSNRLAVKFDREKIDAIFAEANQRHFPDAAMGRPVGGGSVYRKGFGPANVELPVMLSLSTRMRRIHSTFNIVSTGYYAVIIPPRMIGLYILKVFLGSVAKQMMGSHAQSRLRIIPIELGTYS